MVWAVIVTQSNLVGLTIIYIFFLLKFDIYMVKN